MRQMVFLGPGTLEWQEVSDPALEHDREALVRPVAVATCDLDAAIVSGAAPFAGPFAFGHEFVAEVVETGSAVRTVRTGDQVIVPFQISCGACDRCRRGLTGSCASVPLRSAYGLAPLSREWGGALSDLVKVPFPDAMVVSLPPEIDAVAAASVSDNVPDGWRAVAAPLEANPGAPVLVLGGAGSVGLYAAAAAVALGSERVEYVDTDHERLTIAERVGATPLDEPIAARYGPYPVTVNHTLDPAGLVTALRSTDAGGTCTSTTIYFQPEVAVPLLEMYGTGVTLTTGRVNARAAIPPVVELIRARRLRPELVTSQVVDWDDAADVLASHDHKTVVARQRPR